MGTHIVFCVLKSLSKGPNTHIRLTNYDIDCIIYMNFELIYATYLDRLKGCVDRVYISLCVLELWLKGPNVDTISTYIYFK